MIGRMPGALPPNGQAADLPVFVLLAGSRVEWRTRYGLDTLPPREWTSRRFGRLVRRSHVGGADTPTGTVASSPVHAALGRRVARML